MLVFSGSVVTLLFYCHLESDKQPDVGPEIEHRDTPSGGITGLDPNCSGIAWDITPPYDTSTSNIPSNNYKSTLCVML